MTRIKRSHSLVGMDKLHRDVTVLSALSGMERLGAELAVLTREVNRLKRRVDVVDSRAAKWPVRYTRRLALGSNILLGLWTGLSRVVVYLQRRGVVTNVLLPAALRGFTRGASRAAEPLFAEVWWALLSAIWHATPFGLSVWLLLGRGEARRNFGLGLSSAAAAYLAWSSDSRAPWTSLCTILANLMYLVARYTSAPSTTTGGGANGRRATNPSTPLTNPITNRRPAPHPVVPHAGPPSPRHNLSLTSPDSHSPDSQGSVSHRS